MGFHENLNTTLKHETDLIGIFCLGPFQIRLESFPYAEFMYTYQKFAMPVEHCLADCSLPYRWNTVLQTAVCHTGGTLSCRLQFVIPVEHCLAYCSLPYRWNTFLIHGSVRSSFILKSY